MGLHENRLLLVQRHHPRLLQRGERRRGACISCDGLALGRLAREACEQKLQGMIRLGVDATNFLHDHRGMGRFAPPSSGQPLTIRVFK